MSNGNVDVAIPTEKQAGNLLLPNSGGTKDHH
jgi:hypothetical protein